MRLTIPLVNKWWSKYSWVVVQSSENYSLGDDLIEFPCGRNLFTGEKVSELSLFAVIFYTTFITWQDWSLFWNIRRRHWRSSVKKGFLIDFAKLLGKHLCQRLFLNKFTGLRSAILFKKRLWQKCFPDNFVKFRRTPFLQNTSGWLLLDYVFRLWNNFPMSECNLVT